MHGYGNKINSKTIKLIVLAVVLVLVASVAVLYFTVFRNTTNVYKKVITGTVDAAFETVNPKKASKLNVDINIDCNASLVDKEEEKNNPLIKALNESTASINMQTDSKENKSVLHLRSKYGNDKLFDASIYMDMKESKAYIYVKDLLDNYIEVDMTEEAETTETEATIEVDKSAMKKAEKILKEEMSTIITKEMCTKNSGSFVLRTTSTELITNLKAVLERLSKNEEFLNCYENPKEIAESLTSINKSLNLELMDEYQVEVALKLSMTLKVKKVDVRVWDEKSIDVTLSATENLISYNVKKDNKDSLKVSIETTSTDNTSNMKYSIDVVDMGKFDVIMKVKTSELKDVDVMGAQEVKKLNELSLFDYMTLGEKFAETKLGKVIEEVNEYNSSGIIDMANKAVIESDVANLNDSLTLAFVDLKVAYPSLTTFEELTTIVVNDKEYAGIEAYYKAIVPGINENSVEYNVPEGYEVVFNKRTGAATVEKKAESNDGGLIIDSTSTVETPPVVDTTPTVDTTPNVESQPTTDEKQEVPKDVVIQIIQ